jgi:hypothetical protein
VKSRPIRIETRMNTTTPASTCAATTYEIVVTPRIETLSRYDVRRPSVSATTPVGISKSTIPAEKAAFAMNTSPILSPASSKKSVLTPQISDAASVYELANNM